MFPKIKKEDKEAKPLYPLSWS